VNTLIHVGVVQYETARYVDTDLKRYALFFDKIKILETGVLGKALSRLPWLKEKARESNPWINTIDFLEEEGFIYKSETIEAERMFSFAKQLAPDLSSLYVSAYTLATAADAVNGNAYDQNNTKDERDLIKAGAFSSLITRFDALHMRLFEGCDAISLGNILPNQGHGSQGYGNVDRKLSKEDLYEIVVKGVPIPNDTVPWDDILAFRAEETSLRQQRALRLWIAETAKGDLALGEAVDKIESLKEEYRAHLKGAGIKAGTATLKTFVVAAAEVIESALKLKLKSLAEVPFKVVESKTELMEAERKAPGRGLAYVVRVEDKFA